MGKREDLEQAHHQLNTYLSSLKMNNTSLNTVESDFKALCSAWTTDGSVDTLKDISKQLQDIEDAAEEVQRQYNRLKSIHTNLRIDKISIGSTGIDVNTAPSR